MNWQLLVAVVLVAMITVNHNNGRKGLSLLMPPCLMPGKTEVSVNGQPFCVHSENEHARELSNERASGQEAKARGGRHIAAAIDGSYPDALATLDEDYSNAGSTKQPNCSFSSGGAEPAWYLARSNVRNSAVRRGRGLSLRHPLSGASHYDPRPVRPWISSTRRNPPTLIGT